MINHYQINCLEQAYNPFFRNLTYVDNEPSPNTCVYLNVLVEIPDLAAWPNQESILWSTCAVLLVGRRWRRSSVVGTQSLHRMRRMLLFVKTASIFLSATRTGHVSQP